MQVIHKVQQDLNIGYGSTYNMAYDGYYDFSLNFVGEGFVRGNGLYGTYEVNITKFHGIRPVVSIRSGTILKDSGSTIDNCKLWNIQ